MDIDPLPTGVYLPGTTSDYFSTRAPLDWLVSGVGDIDVRFIGRPESWRPTTANGLMAHGIAGDLSWRFSVATNGFLQVNLSTDGVNETSYSSTVAIANQSPINGVRFLRDIATGTLVFYVTRDEGTWVQLGATVATGAGSLHSSAADITVGWGPGFTGYYKGMVRKAEVRSDIVGGLIRAQVDVTRVWSRATWCDVRGNEWIRNGTGGVWRVDRSGVARRVQETDLSNLIGWSFPPSLASSTGSVPALGVITCARIIVPEDRTVRNLNAYILATGSGVAGSGGCYAALHTLDGGRLGVTASLTDFTTGSKSWPLAASVDVKAGIYVVSLLINASGGGTPAAPTFAVGSTSAAVNMGGSSSAGWPFFTADTAQTSIPTTLGTPARNNVSYLFGVS